MGKIKWLGILTIIFTIGWWVLAITTAEQPNWRDVGLIILALLTGGCGVAFFLKYKPHRRQK